MPLQIRRGLNAERTQIAPANGLVEGELLYTTDEKKLYIGTGSVGEHQGVVITGYNDSDAKDAAAEILTTGEHTGIAFTYDSGTKQLNAVVNLSAFDGPIVADALKGSVFADDSSIFLDSIDKVLYGNVIGNVTGNLAGIVTGNLAGNVIGNVTGDIIGNVTGNVTGNLVGDVTGSVFADDSSILVDSTNGVLRGELIGSLTGNVNGNLLNSIGSTIVNTSTRSATFAELNIESSGSIVSPSMLVNSPAVTFLSNTVNPAAPFVNFFIASSAGADTSAVGLVRSRGTFVSPAAVTTSDEIGSIVSSAFDGTTFILATEITSVVDGAVSTGVVPSRIDFSATNSTGALAVKMSVKASAVEFTAPPRLPVIADDTARTAAIPVPAKGMMIMMEAGTTPAATNVVQVYDGSAWVNLH